MFEIYIGVLGGLASLAFVGLLFGCFFYSIDEDDESRDLIKISLFTFLLTPAWPVILPAAVIFGLFLLFRFSFRIALGKD